MNSAAGYQLAAWPSIGSRSRRQPTGSDTAHHNAALGFALGGGSNGNSLADNVTFRNLNGFVVVDSDGNTISANEAHHHFAGAGFVAAGTSSANTFTLNSACQNAADAQDLSTGSGNTWAPDNSFCVSSI